MLVKQEGIKISLLVMLREVLKLGCTQKFVFFTGSCVFCQFGYFLNVHLLKLIFISNSEISADCFRKSSVSFLMIFVLLSGAADANIVGINIKWLEIFIDRNAIADLQIIVFNYEVTPLKITVRMMQNHVVSKLWNHFLQNKKDLFFIGSKSCLSCFWIN